MKTPEQIFEQATRLIKLILLSEDRSSTAAGRWLRLQTIRENALKHI